MLKLSNLVYFADVGKSLFEGDIVLSVFDRRFVDTREEGDVDGDLGQSRQKRNANRNRMVLWQNKIIPYKFDPGLPSKEKKTAFWPKTKYSELNIDCFTGIDQAWYKSILCLGDWTELLLQLSLRLCSFVAGRHRRKVKADPLALFVWRTAVITAIPKQLVLCTFPIFLCVYYPPPPPNIGQRVSSRAKATGLSTCSVKK